MSQKFRMRLIDSKIGKSKTLIELQLLCTQAAAKFQRHNAIYATAAAAAIVLHVLRTCTVGHTSFVLSVPYSDQIHILRSIATFFILSEKIVAIQNKFDLFDKSELP